VSTWTVEQLRLRDPSERSTWIERQLGPDWIEVETGIYELRDPPPASPAAQLLRVTDMLRPN
jgi:hypothetical protein